MHFVSPGARNAFRPETLRLFRFQLALPPAVPEKHVDGGPGLCDQLLARLQPEPLKKAHVLLIPTAQTAECLHPDAQKMVAARTTDDGELVWIHESEIGGAVPSPDDRMFGIQHDWEFRYFWTHDQALFRKVLQETRADIDAALTTHLYDTMRIVEAPRRGRFDLAPIVQQHNMRAHYLLTRGVHRGVFEVYDPKFYFRARSPAIDTVYLIELANRYIADCRGRRAEQWGTFEAVRAVVKQARELLPVGDIESAIFSDEARRPNDPLYLTFLEFRTYARECADKSVPRKLFMQSIERLEPWNDDWKRPATDILNAFGVEHPYLSSSDRILRSEVNEQGIRNYFDFFRFAAEEQSRHSEGPVTSAEEAIQQAVAQIHGDLVAHLQAASPVHRVAMELGAHIESDDLKKSLMTFRLQAGLALDYPWWDQPDADVSNGWSKLDMYAGWLGTSADKLGELVGHFYGDPIVLTKIAQAFANNEKALSDFLRGFVKLNEQLKGPTKENLFIDGVEVRIDAEAKKLQILHNGGVVKELEGVSQIEGVPPLPAGRAELKRKAYDARTNTVRRYKPKRNVPRRYKLPVDIHRWPAFLSAFGDLVSLYQSIAGFSDDCRKNGQIETIANLSMNAFQFIGSGSNSAYVFKGLTTHAPVPFRAIGIVGQLLEAAFDIRNGFVLLFSDTSAVNAALDRGDPLEAQILRVKGGVMLFGSLAPLGVGVFTAEGSAAFGTLIAAVGAPLTLSLVGVALVVVLLDAVVYMHRGPDDQMDDLRTRLHAAMKIEFRQGDFGLVSRTVGELDDFGIGLRAALSAD